MGTLGSLGAVSYDIVAEDKSSDAINSANSSFGGFVVTLGDVMNAVEAVGAPIADAAENFRDWSAESEALAISLGTTSDEIQEIADSVHSADTSMEEALGGVDALTKAYQGNEETVANLLPLYDAFSDATGIDMNEAVKTVSQSMKAFDEPLSNTGKNLDLLTEMTTKTNLTFDDYQKVVERCGVKLGDYGLTTQDVISVMMNLENQGYQGREMVKVFSEAFSDLDAAEKASAKATQQFGDTVKDLYYDEELSIGAKDRLIAAFNKYNSAADGSKEKTSAYNEMLQILNDREGVSVPAKQKLIQLLRDMDGAEGNNLSTKAKLLEMLGLEKGDLAEIQPLLDESVGLTEKQAEAHNKAIGPLEQMNFLMEDITQQFGLFILPVGDAIQYLGGFKDVIELLAMMKLAGLGGSLSGIASGISALGTSAVGAIGSLGLLGPILVGIGLGLAAVYVMNELGVFDWIYNAGYEFGGFVIGAGADFREWLDGVPGWCEDAAEGAKNGFLNLPESIGGAVSSIPDTVGGAFSGLVDIVGSVIGAIPASLVAAFGDINTAFVALGGSVQEAFSNLFTGISEFIVGLAQGFISAGYNIIMYIVQGMQSATGAIGDAIGGIFGFLSEFIPHSPAQRGPLSVLPNFGAYFVDPLLATVPAVQSASLEVAAAATLPAAQPANMSTSSSTTTNDNSVSIGNINASKDYSISDIMAEIATMQALKRTQRGITSG